MKVVFFQRKPHDGYFSLENYFNSIREGMSKEIKCEVAVSTFKSRGIFRRIYNTVEASFRQGDINHVTGDVHFLCYLFNKRKTVLTILDCAFTQYTKGLKYIIFRLFWYVFPEKKSSFITVISHSTKNELLKLVSCNPDKIRVIPVCISSGFVYKEKIFNELRPVILQIGTAKNKNILRLVESIYGISCRLDLVGKLSSEQKEALCKNNIDYNNSWDLSEHDIIIKYQECDIVALVSTYEGFGMPILEANAVGRVVVTSNVLSMPEVAGNAACIVDPFNVLSIRSGISRIINDKEYRDDLVNKGRINLLRYDPSDIVDKYLNLYRDVYGKLDIG